MATKIASQLTDIQSEMTFQSISDKPTWSDAHVSDDMNDEKDHKSLCTSKKLLLSPCSSLSLSSLCGHLALAVCMIIKQIGILMLGEGTVASLEKKMSPMPDGDARYGILALLIPFVIMMMTKIIAICFLPRFCMFVCTCIYR